MFTACGIMRSLCCRPVAWKQRNSASKLPAGNIVGALYHMLHTQSSAPEDGSNRPPKHIELTGIINKPLLLHLVGCLYYLLPVLYRRFFDDLPNIAASLVSPQQGSGHDSAN